MCCAIKFVICTFQSPVGIQFISAAENRIPYDTNIYIYEEENSYVVLA